MMSIELDMRNLIGQMDAITKKATDAIRPAAQAGAQVYYEALLAPGVVPVSKRDHWFQGTEARSKTTTEAKRAASYWYKSGNLKDSIYQVYSKSDSTKDKSVYHVAWNHSDAPYGFMVSAGTKSGAKGNDFVSKARKSVAAKASAAMLNEFAQRIKK